MQIFNKQHGGITKEELEVMTNKDIKIEKVKYKKPKPEEMCKVYDLGNGVIEIETPKVRNIVEELTKMKW